MHLFKILTKKEVFVSHFVLAENESVAGLMEPVYGSEFVCHEETVANSVIDSDCNIQEEMLLHLKNSSKKTFTEDELEAFLIHFGFDIKDSEGSVDSTIVFDIAQEAGFVAYRLDSEDNDLHDSYIFIK